MSRAPKSGFVVAAALLLLGGVTAGIAWRYNLSRTRQALAYWGPSAVALIRDAPQVTVHRIAFATDVIDKPTGNSPLMHPHTRAPAQVLGARDLSQAKGLVHLRHALLDDRSYTWTDQTPANDDFAYILTFEENGARLAIYFSSDLTRMTAIHWAVAPSQRANALQTISTRPIAAGLGEYFADIFR